MRRAREVGEVLQISGVSQFIDIDQGIIWVGFQTITNEITPDEPATPCD
jgi:hypothetical protein